MFFLYMIRGLFSGFSRGPHPEKLRKYLRVYSESSFNDDSVFCSMVERWDSIGSHFEFFTEIPEFGISYFGGLYLFLSKWRNTFYYIFGIMVERKFRTYPWILSTMFRCGVLLGRTQKKGSRIINKNIDKPWKIWSYKMLWIMFMNNLNS